MISLTLSELLISQAQLRKLLPISSAFKANGSTFLKVKSMILRVSLLTVSLQLSRQLSLIQQLRKLTLGYVVCNNLIKKQLTA